MFLLFLDLGNLLLVIRNALDRNKNLQQIYFGQYPFYFSRTFPLSDVCHLMVEPCIVNLEPLSISFLFHLLVNIYRILKNTEVTRNISFFWVGFRVFGLKNLFQKNMRSSIFNIVYSKCLIFLY